MMIYALDSDIISSLLKENVHTISCYHQVLRQGNEFIIPPIVFYKVERGLLMKNLLAKRRAFIEFCKNVEVGDFCFDVWQKAAQIYAQLSKQGKPVGNPFDGDVFIAAYCIVNGYTLVTNNENHYSRIDELQFINWRE